jgi:hypothetical protein
LRIWLVVCRYQSVAKISLGCVCSWRRNDDGDQNGPAVLVGHLPYLDLRNLRNSSLPHKCESCICFFMAYSIDQELLLLCLRLPGLFIAPFSVTAVRRTPGLSTVSERRAILRSGSFIRQWELLDRVCLTSITISGRRFVCSSARLRFNYRNPCRMQRARSKNDWKKCTAAHA